MTDLNKKSDVHAAARQGFTTAAQAYARGRPEYPDDLLAWLTRDLALGAGTSAVDLGAGTGKFTRLLVQAGARVIAIEPVDAMREQLAAKSFAPAGATATAAPVQVLAGTAQAMPLPCASVDAVVCAQAFHWFATPQALTEIHRVLKPGGRLGLVWNVRDESVDWVAAITSLLTPLEGDTPRFHRGDWRRPFEITRLFGQLRESSFAYQHVGTAQEVIFDRFLSVSFVASLPPDRKAELAADLHRLVARFPALAQPPLIAFPYRTRAFVAARI